MPDIFSPPRLTLPAARLSVRRVGGRWLVLDGLRRRWVSLTPEEWVRQHFVAYLTGSLGYPAALLGNEVELRLGSKRVRCDTVLWSREGDVRMIVEYKAPSIAITQRVFNQVSAYNTLLRAPWLVVSNGLSHYCCRMDYTSGACRFLDHVPSWGEL